MYIYAIALKAAPPLCSWSGQWPDCYTRSANVKHIELLLLSACAFVRSPFVTTSSSNQHHIFHKSLKPSGYFTYHHFNTKKTYILSKKIVAAVSHIKVKVTSEQATKA